MQRSRIKTGRKREAAAAEENVPLFRAKKSDRALSAAGRHAATGRRGGACLIGILPKPS